MYFVRVCIPCLLSGPFPSVVVIGNAKEIGKLEDFSSSIVVLVLSTF